MNNFYFYNPTKVLFGREMLPGMNKEMSGYKKILFLYGRGSIKKNGVYEKVLKVLEDNNFKYAEFGDVEPNPDYATCMKAVEFARQNGVDFILAAGGGSVMDAAKFIAISYYCEGLDPWLVVTQKTAPPPKALPVGCVVTAPGTGSQTNGALVLSRREVKQKAAFSHISLYPKFSVLEPDFTFSLPPHQTALGIVDTTVHVLEQYVTYPTYSPLQDRQAEAILSTLIEAGKPVLERPDDYDLRSTIMWCSSQALNGVLSRGTVCDWATHEIGHLLTAIWDIPHAQTLAIVLGGVYRSQFDHKLTKLAQYGRRVWGLNGSDVEAAKESIDRTESFFEGLGIKTRLSSLGLDAADVVREVRHYLETVDFKNLGEHKNIDAGTVCEILAQRG